MHMRPHGEPTHAYMKCFAYEEYGVREQVPKACKNRPYVTMREGNDHKFVMAR